TAALMPIIMLWLGVGDASKTLVIFLGVSLPIVYHGYQGARAVEEKMLWSAAAMGMGPPQRLLRVVLPSALPEVFVGVRTGLVLALITMVTSEMIARQAGVGNILFNSLDMALYDTVYAMIVIIGVLGFIIDVLFERLRAWAVAWAEPVHEIAVGTS
ncbi:MAG: ABC transporter permease subunit, partial [Sphingomonadales bacterium]|nr:ABC transporter permease subunit [Sphingomonadales bacterium]